MSYPPFRPSVARIAPRFAILLVALSLTGHTFAQTARPRAISDPSQQCGLKRLDKCFIAVAKDEAGIVTSPFRIQSHDFLWIVPLGAATGTAIYYDAEAQRRIGNDSSRIDTSKKISDFGGIYAPLGGGAAMYLLGSAVHNDHLRETGVLGLEAVADSAIFNEALKLATNRERPNAGDGRGKFWPHGLRHWTPSSSFASGHSVAAWSMARVVASEYPGWLPRIAVYGLATAVSVTRVTAKEHFPSDVLVGSAVGYLIGGYVYRHHSADYRQEDSYSVFPTVDQRTGTYGLSMQVAPEWLEKHTFGRIFPALGAVNTIRTQGGFK